MEETNKTYDGNAPRISVLDGGEDGNVMFKILQSMADYISNWFPLDAGEVDNVIFQVFKSMADFICKWLPPGVMNKFSPELSAILKLGIWKVSVDKSKASFGQQLLHIKYRDDSQPWKLKLLGLLSIAGFYIKEKILNLSSSHLALRRINFIIDTLETVIKMLNVLTYINFLRNGGPSSFLEFILNLTPVSTVPTSKRNVGYAYMTRELIWHGFIELLVILIPLINYSKLKRKIMKMIKGNVKKQPSSSKSTFTSKSKCAICGELPILPHQMGCSHYFCFYCLATNRETDKTFECPECGFSDPENTAMKPAQMHF